METQEEIIRSLVEIDLINDQNFLKIKETLTRIGIASRLENTLFQSCHILHKRGKFYIVHFKELFKLDGKPSTFTIEDQNIRDSIASMLEKWGLCEIVASSRSNVALHQMQTKLKIIPFHEKKNWKLVAKYTIGRKKVE